MFWKQPSLILILYSESSWWPPNCSGRSHNSLLIFFRFNNPKGGWAFPGPLQNFLIMCTHLLDFNAFPAISVHPPCINHPNVPMPSNSCNFNYFQDGSPVTILTIRICKPFLSHPLQSCGSVVVVSLIGPGWRGMFGVLSRPLYPVRLPTDWFPVWQVD